MNHEYIASSLLESDGEDDSAVCEDRRRCRLRREPHDYILLARLPPLSRLEEDAAQAAAVSAEHAIIGMSMAEALEDELEQPTSPSPASPRRRASSTGSGKSGSSSARPSGPTFSKINSGPSQPRKRPFESHDVYRAIEKKDLATLFEIRDSAFRLLVQKDGGRTPLLHAARIGKSHSDVAILITGALSRFVNQLPDDVSKVDAKTASLIRAVQTNLKIAINESLTTNHTDLISSYLQIINMSQGEKAILTQTQDVALAIKAGKSSRPVRTARTAVTNHATRQLRELDKGKALSSVEDYIANAVCDLLMMALWSLVTDKLGGALLPTYQFSRDERIFKSFSDAIERASRRPEYLLKVNKGIRTLIEETIKIMDKRATGHPEKARLLAQVFDASE